MLPLVRFSCAPPPYFEETMKFQQFLVRKGCTSDQVRRAYLRLLDADDEAPKDEDDARFVDEICSRMRRMIETGFPLNRFARFIDYTFQSETAIRDFRRYVDHLAITPVEKAMLRSIVDRRRTGELSCYADCKPVGDVQIARRDNSADMATDLETYLRVLISEVPSGTKKYELTFSETEK